MPKGHEAIPDLSRYAVEESEETELSTDDLEEIRGGEGTVRAKMDTRVSTGHPDRNDDKVLGVPDRAVSKLDTQRVEWDQANIAKLAEREAKVADTLSDRGVFGVFDGVSAGGAGVLASRIASGAIAERLAAIPKNADAEASRTAIEAAIKDAHKDVLRYRQERPDLKNMSATADIVRAIPNPDGSFDVAYGHVGDSRIYLFDPASGELKRVTEDESLASVMHHGGVVEQEGITQKVESGQVTKEELDRIHAGEPLDIIKNQGAKGLLKMSRNPLMNAVGFPRADIDVKSGTFKAKAGERMYVMTDGVHGTISEKEIADVLRAGGGQKELMDAASKSRAEKKSFDDISAVEVRFEEQRIAPSTEQEVSLRAAADDAMREATALEALLAAADKGDVDALTKVKDEHDGRDNVTEKILIMKGRGLAKEKEMLHGKKGAEQRLTQIDIDQKKIRDEMMGHVARHERQLRESMDSTYAEIASKDSGESGGEKSGKGSSSPEQQKKSFFDKIKGAFGK